MRADACLLLLGSLPGERSLAAGRYYAHPQNQFWQLMSPVVGQDLAELAYDDRLAALIEARIALWDAVAAASRPGSSDAALRDVTANAVPELIAELPELRVVAFNGAKAASIGRAALRAGAFSGALIDLPSSSPLHTIGRLAKQPAWSALASYLA